MDVQTLTFIIVGLTFAIYIGIAIWARASTTGEFYVAGKGINPVANGMATAADWMSAASFISMAGLIAFFGYGGSVFLMGWTGGYVLLAMLLAPYLRKHGSFTVPEFIGDRYKSRSARVVAVICLIIASITYVIGQMTGVGVAFSRFLEVGYGVGLATGIGIVFFYAVLGGMKGITYTQIAQYIIMIIAYTVPAIFISLTITGHVLPQIGLGATIGDSGVYLLDKLDETVNAVGFADYTTHKRISTLNMFFYTLSLMIGTAGLPHVIMRFFTVPKVSDARRSAGWALVFIAILYTTAPAVAAMARYNLMNTIEPSPGNNLNYDDRPDWFKKWETTGLLTFEDKNGDGKIQYTASGDTNELTVNRDIMVLANPEIAKLPNWVIALVAAGGLAAALSTAAGLLIAIASAISHDLLKGVFMPHISEKQELMYSRITMAVVVVFAGYLGFNPPDFAAGTVALAFGLAASSLFPAIMLGVFTKTNKQAVVAGMLAGIIITLLYVFQHRGIMFIPGTSFMGGMSPNWFLGIEPNAFGSIGAIFNFVVAYAVNKVTKPISPEIEQIIENMRVPKGGTAPAVHLGEVAEH